MKRLAIISESGMRRVRWIYVFKSIRSGLWGFCSGRRDKCETEGVVGGRADAFDVPAVAVEFERLIDLAVGLYQNGIEMAARVFEGKADKSS